MKSTFTGLTTIVAILIAANCVQSQFTITIPKLPKVKKEKPQIKIESSDQPPTVTTSDTPMDSSPSSASQSPAGVRGRPISGARITFSNNPDGSNPKTTFSSSEFIYGRLDLGGRTMHDAFGFKAMGDAKFYYIRYHLKILPAGQQVWEHDWHNNRNFTLITKADSQKTYWNFDVLPNPAKVSTMTSPLEDELEHYKHISGIYGLWYNADSARSTFPKSGTYTVDITLYGSAFDDWGKPTGKTEDYPTASANFAFEFSGPDGQSLVANSVKARESLEAAKNQREMLRAMPDWWLKGGTYPAEPRLAAARLVPMIKGFIAQWNLTYLKHMIVKTDGPLWTIKKNELGIPTFKDLSPYIHIIYKDPKENNSCQLGAIYMRQPYAGAGTYGEAFLGGIRDVQYIDCAVVK